MNVDRERLIEEFREQDAARAARPARDAAPVCAHRGAQVGRSACCGATYKCALHGKVTLRRCAVCKDRQEVGK